MRLRHSTRRSRQRPFQPWAATVEVPTFRPVADINHCLGSLHPDAVLFSNYMVEEFGGADEVRKDFGGFLMKFSAFLDQYLAIAQAVVFNDEGVPEDHVHREPDGSWTSNVNWEDPKVIKLLIDPSLTAEALGLMLGCCGSRVRERRRRAGIDIKALRAAQRHLARQTDDETVPSCKECGEPFPPERFDPSLPGPRPTFCGQACGKRYRYHQRLTPVVQ